MRKLGFDIKGAGLPYAGELSLFNSQQLVQPGFGLGEGFGHAGSRSRRRRRSRSSGRGRTWDNVHIHYRFFPFGDARYRQLLQQIFYAFLGGVIDIGKDGFGKKTTGSCLVGGFFFRSGTLTDDGLGNPPDGFHSGTVLGIGGVKLTVKFLEFFPASL